MSPHQTTRFAVTVFGLTDVGRVRSDNQDCFAATGPSVQSPAARMVLGPAPDGDPGATIPHRPGTESRLVAGPGLVLLLVADGMGGVRGGATASRIAASTIVDEINRHEAGDLSDSPDELRASLRRAVETAGSRIRERSIAQEELRGMGTTVTAVGIWRGQAVCAQVGDSRCYLYREGRLKQLTRDQTVVQDLVDAGSMTAEEARVSDQRNVILQALGSTAPLDVVIDVVSLMDGDVLLLCSDGLTGVVDDSDLSAALSATTTLSEAGDRLVRLANEAGGPDNITVLLARADRQE